MASVDAQVARRRRMHDGVRRPASARRAVLLACTVLLAGCSGSPGKDGGADDGGTTDGGDNATANATLQAAAFSMDGTGCQELLVIVSIPMAQARQFVPTSYTLLGAPTGRATAFAGLKQCADLALDGVSIGAASTSDVGIFVDKGEPGVFHYYQAWWTTDNPIVVARLLAQGWTTGLAVDELMAMPSLPVGSSAAQVEWANATYDFVGSDIAAAVPGDNRAVGWFDAPAGTVTVDKTLRGTRLGAGTGSIVGDGLAGQLFANAEDGLSLWNEYAMDAAVGPAA